MKIKHLEHLEDGAYFGEEALPCVVREMRDAPSNEAVAMHDHGFSELVIVAAGSLKHIHATGTERIAVGDFFVIHPGERHGFAEFAKGALVFNVLYHADNLPPALMFSGSPLVPVLFPRDTLPARARTLGRVPRSGMKGVVSLLTAIRSEEASRRPLRHEVCASLFATLALQLARHTRVAVRDPSSSIHAELDFIAQNYARKITIGELRAVTGLSTRALYSEFRKVCGKTPWEYVTDMRVAKAEALLAQPKMKLEEVAAQTGFCGASHLSRTLRAHRKRVATSH
jgi:AraC-like DNA-binding protein/mannose-6-phosphate isomerase-like protein (cupin superfamily)